MSTDGAPEDHDGDDLAQLPSAQTWITTPAGRTAGLDAQALPRVVGGYAAGVTLPALASSPRRARALVRQVCQRVGLPAALVQETVALTSEVVTNAVRHAGGDAEPVVVVSAAGVYIEVSDGSTALPPVPLDPRTPGIADRGRGTSMLDAWADGWGVTARVDGKVVWFELHAT